MAKVRRWHNLRPTPSGRVFCCQCASIVVGCGHSEWYEVTEEVDGGQ